MKLIPWQDEEEQLQNIIFPKGAILVKFDITESPGQEEADSGHVKQRSRKWIALIAVLLDKMPSIRQIQFWENVKLVNSYNLSIV